MEENKNLPGLYPLKFDPILKDKIWGGKKMNRLLNKPSDSSLLGESWELAAHDDDVSLVNNGPLKGKSLNQLITDYQADLLGDAVYDRHGDKFPLLFKLIDANQDLSIQVHPDDEVAQERHQSFGKTEMWFVIDAEDDSEIIVGFKEDYSQEIYLKAVEEGTLDDLLQRVKVQKGDAFFIPAGMVHSIGKGVVLAEIQQNSDVTYRIYDFDRKDESGQLRELHTDLALDVIDFSATSDPKTVYESEINEVQTLVQSEFFTCNLIQFNEEFNRFYGKVDSFVVYMCIEGELNIVSDGQKTHLTKGETALIPANIYEVTLEPSEQATLLEVYIA